MLVAGQGALDESGNLVDPTKLEERPVTLGRSSSEYIEILDGLEEGETVYVQNIASNAMAMMMGVAERMEHLIELKNVYKIYQMGEETVHALDGVSLTIDQGEFVAIVGSSGSGKSTAMNIIGCLDVPTSGTYHLGGIDVSTMDDDQQAEIRNKMLGFIFQQYNLIPKLNVLENVELPLLYAGVDASERKERAMASLQRVGLADKCRNLPSQLSGGQQQRVSIARALAGSPSVILADEPTGALDSRTGREVLGFLKKLNREGDTVVLITHDNSIAVKADRIVRLQDGKIIYDGDAHDPRAVVRPEEMEQDEPAAGGFSDASPAEQEAGA